MYFLFTRTLSPFALEALAQFHAEKEAHRHKFEKLQAEAEEVEDEPLSMELFGEDWNESQFWVRMQIGGFG